MNKIAAIPLLAIGLSFGAVKPLPAQAPKVVVSTPHHQIEPVEPPKQVNLTPRRLKVPASAKCGLWWQAMLDAGWRSEDLLVADRVMWKESRCLAWVNNTNDPNTVNGVKGSVGLFQVNVFWVQKTRFYPSGYLQTLGVVSGVQDLFDPVANIKAALAVFQYSEKFNGCGWQPWTVRCQ